MFATGARDGNVMVWDMRCNRRSGQFYQPVNVISNAHAERLPGTPQTTKKKARRSSTPRPVMVSNESTSSITLYMPQSYRSLINCITFVPWIFVNCPREVTVSERLCETINKVSSIVS